jgi:predicted nucleic acid-binding Zn ribbon protein
MDNKLQINLKEQPSVICEKCGSDRFREVTFIKKVSKLMTGSSQDTIVPFPTYCCDSCGHINQEFEVFTND